MAESARQACYLRYYETKYENRDLHGCPGSFFFDNAGGMEGGGGGGVGTCFQILFRVFLHVPESFVFFFSYFSDRIE